MVKTRLCADGEVGGAQKAIVGFWILNLLLVVILWITTTVFSGPVSNLIDAVGMLFGLLATYFALTQFMLMGRIGWIERHFGLDHLASYHRINGYLTITCILIHPILITISYAMDAHKNLFSEYIDIVLHDNFVWLAFIAQILFIAVAGSSIYIARRHLKFENWYYVHLTVYVAIVSVVFHQLTVGDSFAGSAHPLARIYWLSLYGFVAINLAIWRFGKPLYNLWRFKFHVARVVAETPTTSSVYIKGNNLQKWRVLPGQFVMVRFLSKEGWRQEHPFSVSRMPHDNVFRLTIRQVGDYTSDIVPSLKSGTRVLVSGPYGRFTHEVAITDKRLYIAGGIGITPLRSLLAESAHGNTDSVLIYGNKSPTDVPLGHELQKLICDKSRLVNVYSEPAPGYGGERGYVDLARIQRLVPDYYSRDMYICGPPSMMEHIIQELRAAAFPPRQLHYERFALQN